MAQKEFFGLDVGNRSIKIVQLEKIDTPKPRLVAFGAGSTPVGVLGSENDLHKEALAKAIQDVVKAAEISTKNVVIALPEGSVFSRLTTIPYVEGKNFEEAVYWEAKKSIPGNIEDVVVKPLVVAAKDVNGQKMLDVLIVAAPNSIIDRYLDIAQRANLNPIAMETEGIAIVRSLMRTYQQGSSAIVMDWGSQTTEMSVARPEGIVWSQSIPIGSDTITRALMQSFQLSWNQAEEYKKTYGLDMQYMGGKVAGIIKPVVDSILVEVKRAIDYFKKDFPDVQITKVLYVGDASLLPGLIPYSANYLQLDVQAGDPWSGIEIDEKFKPLLLKGAPGYAVAIGLALKQDF